jgi:hypothetical protein
MFLFLWNDNYSFAERPGSKLFMHVLPASEVKSDEVDQNSRRLGLSCTNQTNPVAQKIIKVQELEDKDENIRPLYDLLELLNNRLIRTATHIESHAEINKAPRFLNSDDLKHLWKLLIGVLKARFRRHELDTENQSPDVYEGQDEKGLQILSEQRLKSLLSTYGKEQLTPTTRKRVYSKDEAFAEAAQDVRATMSVTLQSQAFRVLTTVAVQSKRNSCTCIA